MRFHGDMLVRACFLVGLALPLLTAGCGDDRRPAPVDSGVPPGTDGGPRPDGSPPDVDAWVEPSPWVDPACIDGMYSETPPTPEVSIDDLISGYAGDYQGFVAEALTRRYPLGGEVVRRGQGFTMLGDCVERFVGSPGSAEDVLRRIETIVHECGHFADLGTGGFSDAYYFINEDIEFTCTQGDTTSRGGRTFARSRINGDEYSAMRPPCGGPSSPGCDFYGDVYLDGDPDDGTFEGGDQGFNSVLEETTQYVNSLATGYAFNDQIRGSISNRDGILTFLWYVERYLRMARTSYPDAYSTLSADPCWRRGILTVWGRAFFYLALTEGMGQLGINDDVILGLVTDPTLLEEIQRLRDLEGC